MLNNKLFKYIHSNHLIYNTCWEDPECDRILLDLDENSEILMITSAGCNALDYLLDYPKSIHCVDLNPRQNALLQLKQSFFSQSDYQQLFRTFGNGVNNEIKPLFQDTLKNYLSDDALRYWSKHLYFFLTSGLRKSFYYHGTSGFLAWVLQKLILSKKKVKDKLEKLIHSTSLEAQKEIYEELEPEIFNKSVQSLVNTDLFMSMIGVPKEQVNLIYKNNSPIIFIQSSLRKVFTEIPMQDNYFWRLYIQSKYDENCCPNYLKKENFQSISENIDKIKTYNTSISSFLEQNPGQYSHFILLDHMDWLVKNNHDALIKEWELILENSKSGSKILLRSASNEVNFIPEFVRQKVFFNDNLAKAIHQKDRVGTYGSVLIGTKI